MDRIKARGHVYNGMPARELGSEGWLKPGRPHRLSDLQNKSK